MSLVSPRARTALTCRGPTGRLAMTSASRPPPPQGMIGEEFGYGTTRSDSRTLAVGDTKLPVSGRAGPNRAPPRPPPASSSAERDCVRVAPSRRCPGARCDYA
jgi:hypothetical protein